jgi:aryl sulfotransferase
VRSYASEDNERWDGFEHRAGDIVISTRTKCGTTWMQMICALLVFQDPDLPAPLAEISPWLDWDVEPLATVTDRLAAQTRRRIIKTHTPLDGIPIHPDVTYIVVGRHPLDVAVSLHHHRANLDRARIAELTRTPLGFPPPETLPRWFREWAGGEVPPEVQLDTLRGLVHHVRDAIEPRPDADVVLVHYRDLADDLEGQMRSLASRLGIAVPDATWPALIDAASFGSMKRSATKHAPDRLGIIRDADAFFRGGRTGDGLAAFSSDELAFYGSRVRELADPDLVRWLEHGGPPPSG